MTDKAKQLLLGDAIAIDQRATAKNVRNFFENYFDRWLGIAGLDPVSLSVIDDSHLSSPKMDASGVSAHTGINHQEDSALQILLAERACYAVVKSINRCRETPGMRYRTIMKECYLKGLNDQAVMGLLGYQHSWFENLKRRAECNFADTWAKYKKECNVDSLDDLRVFRDNTKAGNERGQKQLDNGNCAV